jgi:hypothetical protein
MDNEQKHRPGLAKCIPSVAVGMGILPGQGQWIAECDLANTQRQSVFAAVDSVLIRIPRPTQNRTPVYTKM